MSSLLRTATLVSICCLGLGACATADQGAGTTASTAPASKPMAAARPPAAPAPARVAAIPAPAPALNSPGLDSNVAMAGMPDRVSAARLLGQEVISSDGERIGSVKDVILDRAGNARQAIIGASGGDIAVSLSALRRTANNGDQWVLAGTSLAQAKALPRYRYDQDEVALQRRDAEPGRADQPAPVPLLIP